MAKLLHAGELIQSLLHEASVEHDNMWTTEADLDVDSIEEIPFVTHSEIIARVDESLWDVNLTINLFLDPAGAQPIVDVLYDVVTTWAENPDAGIIPGVGAVEKLEDASAFMPVSGEVLMVNKVVRHYQGSFNLRVRNN